MVKPKGHDRIDAQLLAAIEDSGMTAYAIAKRAGTTQAVLRRFMLGQRDLRLETAAKIAEVLGLELHKRP